jgi:hypothetical protein
MVTWWYRIVPMRAERLEDLAEPLLERGFGKYLAG